MIEVKIERAELNDSKGKLGTTDLVKSLTLSVEAYLIHEDSGEEVFFEGDIGQVAFDLKTLMDAEDVIWDIENRAAVLTMISLTSYSTNTTWEVGELAPFTLTGDDIQAMIRRARWRKEIPFKKGSNAVYLELEEKDRHGNTIPDSLEVETSGAFILSSNVTDDFLDALTEISGVRPYDHERQQTIAFEARARKLNEITVVANPSLQTHAPGLSDLSHDESEYGKPKHYMARKNLRILQDYAVELLELLDEGATLPEWIEAQITVASTYVRDAKHYLEHGEPLAESKPMKIVPRRPQARWDMATSKSPWSNKQRYGR